MDTGESPALPTPTHEAGPWNVLRATLLKHAHDVDGIAYIGVTGTRLTDEIAATWVNETRQLVTDLKIAFSYLPDDILRYAVSEIDQAAEATLAMRVSAELVPANGHEEDRPARQRPRRRDDAATALADSGAEHEGAVVS